MYCGFQQQNLSSNATSHTFKGLMPNNAYNITAYSMIINHQERLEESKREEREVVTMKPPGVTSKFAMRIEELL